MAISHSNFNIKAMEENREKNIKDLKDLAKANGIKLDSNPIADLLNKLASDLENIHHILRNKISFGDHISEKEIYEEANNGFPKFTIECEKTTKALQNAITQLIDLFPEKLKAHVKLITNSIASNLEMSMKELRCFIESECQTRFKSGVL